MYGCILNQLSIANEFGVFFEVDPYPPLGIRLSDSFVEVHDVSLDSDTDTIQTILNREFELLTNDGSFGIECYRDFKNRINEILSAKYRNKFPTAQAVKYCG